MIAVPPGQIGIAGAGRIGQALGRLLLDRGEPVVAIAGRDPDRTARAAEFIGPGVRACSYGELPAHAARILIAVADDALEQVAANLAVKMHVGAALHTCGSRGPEALGALAEKGVSCAALHPLQTVATPQQGLAALPGSLFAITGSGAAAEWAFAIVTLLEGEALNIAPEQRPLYHAAAVMASNYIAALIDAAVILMRGAGIEEQQALRALAPLIRTSVENALTAGPVQALTGPIERGDDGTVAAHLRAMGAAPDSVEALYRAAGLHAVQMAMRKFAGITREKTEHLLRELSS